MLIVAGISLFVLKSAMHLGVGLLIFQYFMSHLRRPERNISAFAPYGSMFWHLPQKACSCRLAGLMLSFFPRPRLIQHCMPVVLSVQKCRQAPYIQRIVSTFPTSAVFPLMTSPASIHCKVRKIASSIRATEL